MDAEAGEMNEVVAIYKFSSIFVFEIACFSTSTGFSWDHGMESLQLSSRLVRILGHKYYFVPTGTQAGHRPKFRDCPGQTGTLGNYVAQWSNSDTTLVCVTLDCGDTNQLTHPYKCCME